MPGKCCITGLDTQPREHIFNLKMGSCDIQSLGTRSGVHSPRKHLVVRHLHAGHTISGFIQCLHWFRSPRAAVPAADAGINRACVASRKVKSGLEH